MAYADGANDVNRSIWWYGLGDNGAISDVIKYLSFDCFIGLAHANLARVPPRRVLPCVTILPHVKQPLTPQNTVYSWVAEADGAIFMSIVQYCIAFNCCISIDLSNADKYSTCTSTCNMK